MWTSNGSHQLQFVVVLYEAGYLWRVLASETNTHTHTQKRHIIREQGAIPNGFLNQIDATV